GHVDGSGREALEPASPLPPPPPRTSPATSREMEHRSERVMPTPARPGSRPSRNRSRSSRRAGEEEDGSRESLVTDRNTSGTKDATAPIVRSRLPCPYARVAANLSPAPPSVPPAASLPSPDARRHPGPRTARRQSSPQWRVPGGG